MSLPSGRTPSAQPSGPGDSEDLYMSVGVLTYNSERTIEKCLKAVLYQEYDRNQLDIFILDAGSKDRTLDIAKDFGLPVYMEIGCTRGRARNLCIERAKAGILVMLDSDIVIPKGWLSKVAGYFSNPDVGEVASPYYTPVPASSILQKVIYYVTSGWEVHTKGAERREDWVSE